MTTQSAADSPLEAAGGAAGAQAAEAFEILGSETRLAILLALWDAYDPHAHTNAVTFSELRERVGIRDSGQFNYHLEKLTDRFIARTEEGYTLRSIGLQLVQTVIAGAGEDVSLDRTEIDVGCSRCGGATAVMYEDGWLYHVCTECDGGFGHWSDTPEGMLFGEPFPATALKNRTPEELFAAGMFRLHQISQMKAGGLCPRCSGVVESLLDVCEDHETPDGEPCPSCGSHRQFLVRWVCTVCKYRGSSSPAGVARFHPAVIGFFHDHGIDAGVTSEDFEDAKLMLSTLRGHDQELISTDPIRIRVTIRHDDAEISLTLDEDLDVIDIQETE